VSVSLSTGSRALARKRVVVKRLVTIEDLGNIEVLFTDKTGTVTEGRHHVPRGLDPTGTPATQPLPLGLVCNEATMTADGAVDGNALDQALYEATARRAAAPRAEPLRATGNAPLRSRAPGRHGAGSRGRRRDDAHHQGRAVGRPRATAFAPSGGRRVSVVSDPRDTVGGANAVYTDVWVSMGQDEEGERRREELSRFRVDRADQPGGGDAIFLHCLPAHRGQEVAAEVIDGPRSAVWQQAAHRLPTEQALLYELVTGDGRAGRAEWSASSSPSTQCSAGAADYVGRLVLHPG
jgi:Aspartate/ornithine carbamoyltransferase, Asp/Orn binding domain